MSTADLIGKRHTFTHMHMWDDLPSSSNWFKNNLQTRRVQFPVFLGNLCTYLFHRPVKKSFCDIRLYCFSICVHEKICSLQRYGPFSSQRPYSSCLLNILPFLDAPWFTSDERSILSSNRCRLPPSNCKDVFRFLQLGKLSNFWL